MPHSGANELEAMMKSKHILGDSKGSVTVPWVGSRHMLASSDWTWRRRWCIWSRILTSNMCNLINKMH